MRLHSFGGASPAGDTPESGSRKCGGNNRTGLHTFFATGFRQRLHLVLVDLDLPDFSI